MIHGMIVDCVLREGNQIDMKGDRSMKKGANGGVLRRQ